MDSTPEQASEGLSVVRVLGSVLERLVATNSAVERPDKNQITKFHALKAPGIGIIQYLERIHKYASCSTECFILALIYIDRLIQGNNFLLTELNVHRVIITSVLLAAKFFDDAYYNNAYYAKVGGVLVSEMNRLEVEFLFRINFSLYVNPELYRKYNAELVAHAAGDESLMSPLHEENNLCNSLHLSYGRNFSHMESQVQPIIASMDENNCAMTSRELPDCSQYIVNMPSQITPSPPKVQLLTYSDPPQYRVSSTVDDISQVQWSQASSCDWKNKIEHNLNPVMSSNNNPLIHPSVRHNHHSQYPEFLRPINPQGANHAHGEMICTELVDPRNVMCNGYYPMSSSDTLLRNETPTNTGGHYHQNNAPEDIYHRHPISSLQHQHVMYQQDNTPSTQNSSIRVTDGLGSKIIDQPHLIVGYGKFQSRLKGIQIRN